MWAGTGSRPSRAGLANGTGGPCGGAPTGGPLGTEAWQGAWHGHPRSMAPPPKKFAGWNLSIAAGQRRGVKDRRRDSVSQRRRAPAVH
jgi:hypothetical protein